MRSTWLKTKDALLHAGRWLIWKPLRLVVAVLVVLVLAGGLHHFLTASKPVTPPDSTQTGPAGWTDWPGATAVPTQGKASTSPSATPTPASATPTGDTPAVWNDYSRAAAMAAGIDALTAYTTGDQDELNALLGWEITITVSPAPVVIVTPDPDQPGAITPHLDSENSPLVTTVVIPTDGGTYEVTVARRDGGSPWLVQSIKGPS